jgi:hypothetical protein
MSCHISEFITKLSVGNGGGEECIWGISGKSGKKRPLERPKRRWECNIKMNLREIGLNGMDWIDMAQDRDQ